MIISSPFVYIHNTRRWCWMLCIVLVRWHNLPSGRSVLSAGSPPLSTKSFWTDHPDSCINRKRASLKDEFRQSTWHDEPGNSPIKHSLLFSVVVLIITVWKCDTLLIQTGQTVLFREVRGHVQPYWSWYRLRALLKSTSAGSVFDDAI